MVRYIYVLLVLILVNVHCFERVTDPDVTIYHERLTSKSFTSNLGETATLKYSSYPGVFAMQLYQREHNGSNVYYENNDIAGDSFGVSEAMASGVSGCHSIQRHIEVDEELKLRLRLPSNQEIFYNDVVAIQGQNKAIIVRNDYVLFEIDTSGSLEIEVIEESKQFKRFDDLLQLELSNNTHQQVFLVEDTELNRVYIITEDGGLSFPSNIFEFVVEDFLLRNTIYAVHYSEKHQVIFVACGLDGVDVYDVESGNAVLYANINATSMGFKDGAINIVDADSNYDETLLYILDFERGLLVVDISDPDNFMIVDFNIPITKARFFDHIGNTFFIVAETQNLQDYCVEVFVDFPKKQYHYNRFYIDEMAIFDVKMFDQFVVLIGFDAHKVVYHSVFDGFIDGELERHTYFQEPGLVKVAEMDLVFSDMSHQLTLVGLSKSEFKLFKINNYIPTIVCHSEVAQKNSTYFLKMNATDCPLKQHYQDNSTFSQCQIHQAFFYSAIDVLLHIKYKSRTIADKVKKYAIMIYFLLFIMIWIVIIAIYCYRNCGRTLNFLKWKNAKLAKKEAYDDFNQPQVEMTQGDQQQSAHQTQEV